MTGRIELPTRVDEAIASEGWFEPGVAAGVRRALLHEIAPQRATALYRAGIRAAACRALQDCLARLAFGAERTEPYDEATRARIMETVLGAASSAAALERWIKDALVPHLDRPAALRAMTLYVNEVVVKLALVQAGDAAIPNVVVPGSENLH